MCSESNESKYFMRNFSKTLAVSCKAKVKAKVRVRVHVYVQAHKPTAPQAEVGVEFAVEVK